MARSREKKAFGGCQRNLWGALVIRLGDSARQSGLPLLKKIPRFPEPGQYVDLRTENGAWLQAFRALSKPWTTDAEGVMIRAAGREGRSAVGVPWSTERLRLTSPRPVEPVSLVSVRWAAGRTQVYIGR